MPFAWGGLVSADGSAWCFRWWVRRGILASFALTSVLGLTDANQVKPMAQGLTLATPLIAAPHYLRQLQRRAQNGADVDFLVDGGITGTRKNRQ